MHCARMLSLSKVPLRWTLQRASEYGLPVTQHRRFWKSARTKDAPKAVVKPISSPGILKRVSYRFDLYKRKYQLIGLGYQLYDDIPDKLNYQPFFKGLNMPDTFYSWFLVTELHVWMLMVRFMAEGETGKVVVQNIVEAMWHDVLIRMDLLGPISSKLKKKQVMDLSQQFNAAVIGYDEGIMSDDKVLAGALWRRFFCLECNNPEHLERLLIYVRKQTGILDRIPSEKVFHRSMVQWIDLEEIN